MRLAVLEHGHRRRAKAFQRLVALVLRQDVDAVVKTALHRPDFFGRSFLDLVSDVMRGPSYWTSGEREYMAMFTSRLNQCPFCIRVHTETMRIESGGEIEVEGAVPLRPQLTAVLHLLEQITQSAGDVTSDEVDAVRTAGVPDDAIVDALHVNLVFNIANRLANAFEWTWESDDHVRTGARVIHLTRYKLPRFLLR